MFWYLLLLAPKEYVFVAKGVTFPKLTLLDVSDPSVVTLPNVIPVRFAPLPKYSVAPTSPETSRVLPGLILYIPILPGPVSTFKAVTVPEIGFTLFQSLVHSPVFVKQHCLLILPT